MSDQVRNFIKFPVIGTYDASATSITLYAADVAKLPSPPFTLTWYNASDYPDPVDDPKVEMVRVTATGTTTLTIIRGDEGTTPSTKNTLNKIYRVVQSFSKGLYEQFVSFTGATSGLNLDGQSLTARTVSAWTVSAMGISAQDCLYAYSHLKLEPQSADPSYEQGAIFYDSGKDSIAFYPSVQGVNIYPGQQTQLVVYNNTGNTLSKGRALQIIGQQGTRTLVALASAQYSTVGASSFCMGIVTNDIPTGQSGYMVTHGLVYGLNTNSFTEGDKLWLSGTGTPGSYENRIPQYPSTEGFVGQVVYKHPTDGIIFFNPSYPKSYGPSMTAYQFILSSPNKGRSWFNFVPSSNSSVTASFVSPVGDAQRVGSFSLGTSGHTGIHTITGTPSHTVTVVNGIITSWVEA